jgi:hypothetical protein
VVAVASPAELKATGRARAFGWTAAAGGALVLGVLIRLALGGTGVGDRSGIVMAVLLTVGAWLAARLVAGPRLAFGAAAVLLVLFDIAALPPRGDPEYDDLQAFYRTDQLLTVQSAVLPAISQSASDGAAAVSLVAQPVFAGEQPAFGLAADVNGSSLNWTCPFQHAIQHLALPLPRAVLQGVSSLDVRLHLSGAPSRESEYLIVYASSLRGGFLVSLDAATSVDSGATRCSLS